MSWLKSCACSFVAILGISVSLVLGNEVISVELVPDGSGDPPGDRLDVSVVLYREVRNAQLEVAAYIVKGERNEAQEPVPSKSETNVDRKGNFRLINSLRTRGEDIDPVPTDGERLITRFDRRLVVPYRDLRLEKGEYSLGYVVTLKVDEGPVDAFATSLTRLIVSDETRRQLFIKVTRPVEEAREQKVTFNVWKDDRLVATDANVVVSVIKEVAETREFDVAIEGGFQRQQLAGASPNAASSDENVKAPSPRVYFATNRELKLDDSLPREDQFTDTSVIGTDEMRYGSCTVSIPLDKYHVPGRIEAPGPSWWFWTETADPEKHFLIRKVDSLDEEKFRREFDQQDLLIYVHGYNNTFKAAILRSAQLQHDLRFPGKMLAFCWPSAGKTLVSELNPFSITSPKVKLAYTHDEAQAKLSHPFLTELVRQLLKQPPDKRPRRIHFLAHSMGNRVLLHALHDLRTNGDISDDRSAFGEIMLTAADVDGATYGNVKTALMNSCERVTFYFAADDVALLLSQGLHVNKPIGLEACFDEAKMDTINASNLTSVFNNLGHLYATESAFVLKDMQLLLNRRLPPIQRRPPLGQRVEDPQLLNYFYWTFPPR
jgi:esterase/lipase superfamily enzyme